MPLAGYDDDECCHCLLIIGGKTGDYVIVSSASHDFITSHGEKGKVKYMIEHILYRKQIKHLQDKGLW